MKLTEKLLGYLSRVFDKNPAPVLALRFRYDGSMTWTVADGRLTATTTGGSGSGFSVDLTSYTIASLADYIASLPGFSVLYEDVENVGSCSALVLIEGSGDQDRSNGDHLYAYTSLLWAYMEAVANELMLLRAAIAEALLQMAANTASGEWVDEHGSYYNVPRLAADTSDEAYAARIVAEVIKARGNNIAIADAVKTALGAVSVKVDDYKVVTTAGDGTKSYGLFDMSIELSEATDLDSIQLQEMVNHVLEVIRDAGTHLRRLKYLRKSNMVIYAGAAMRIGVNATVYYLPDRIIITEDGNPVVTQNGYYVEAQALTPEETVVANELHIFLNETMPSMDWYS